MPISVRRPFQYDRWRCITAVECSNKSFRYNAEEINLSKQYKAYNGECIMGCPEETKENKTKDGIWICEVWCARVDRFVCEKVAQNVAQSISCLN
jgi:hypothetical protein